ncbi:MAG: SDR family oxidoreductase [Myxococcales bacterium]|nr:SDR family oxidoreductase [Myxococcota bacterium]MDW8280397.1 SDR family oxidoreductase [Myxococcales bacterium]
MVPPLSILITGASAGIGAATATALAPLGHRLVLCGRRPEPLQALADQLGALAVPADVAQPADRARLLERTAAHLGDVPDVVIHAAGAFALGPVAGDEANLLERLWPVNVQAPYALAAATLPAMIRRGSGRHIFIGSVAGRRCFPGNGAYSATKFALRGLWGVLDEELRGTGVSATLIEPAATDTPLWDPIARDASPGLPERRAMLRPEEVAAFVVFAATRPAGVVPSLLTVRAER